ncbi:peptidase M4 family protein, partial [Pseudomonas syringae]
FAEVIGIRERKQNHGTRACEPDGVVGKVDLVPAQNRRGVRDMDKPGPAYANDLVLSDDPQPATMADLYTGARERGGVHIYSGIPSSALLLVA